MHLDPYRASELLLEECRMVLPGLQALFGFQLIAVFSDGFHVRLSGGEQIAHLCAMGLVLLSIALVMTPASLHRRRGPMEVSEAFVRLTARLLLLSMPSLMLAICVDVYLVTQVIVGSRGVSLAVAIATGAMFSALWFVLPRKVQL